MSVVCAITGKYIGPSQNKYPNTWDWSQNPIRRVIRYRIRKPRALLSMIERAKELDNAPEGPVRAKPRVTA